MDPMEALYRTLELLAVPAVGVLTVYLMAGVKRLVGWVDRLPVLVQQLVVLVIAAAVTWLGVFFGVEGLPTDLTLWTDPNASALLSALVAFALHAAQKRRTNGGG